MSGIDIQQARSDYHQGDAFKLLVEKLHWLRDYDLPVLRQNVENAENQVRIAKEAEERALKLKGELERGVAALKGIAV